MSSPLVNVCTNVASTSKGALDQCFFVRSLRGKFFNLLTIAQKLECWTRSPRAPPYIPFTITTKSFQSCCFSLIWIHSCPLTIFYRILWSISLNFIKLGESTMRWTWWVGSSIMLLTEIGKLQDKRKITLKLNIIMTEIWPLLIGKEP